MEEETKVDPLYKKGFEQAYWLKRGNNPHLNDIIQNNANGNKYHSGLLAGKKEAEREKLRERLQSTKHDKLNDKGIDL